MVRVGRFMPAFCIPAFYARSIRPRRNASESVPMHARTEGPRSSALAEHDIGQAWRALPSLPDALRGAGIEVVARTGSTNDDLVRRARRAAPATPQIRIALEQTAGRGRLGRGWHAPAGTAILMSVAVPLTPPPVQAAVTLACGVCVAETLRRAQVKAELKWPNDVLFGGRKLAGLLAELATDGGGANTLVVGIGLNLIRPRGVPDDGPQRAVLAEAIAIDDAIAAHRDWSVLLAAALFEGIDGVLRDGFAPFAERFNALFAWRARPVNVIDPQRTQVRELAAGIAIGVDDMGRLRIDAGGTVVAVASGDVSLRAAANAET
jgi:BirA family biotin operon repressor/biotin-[acetyl-CoA-carboxylase] ligase